MFITSFIGDTVKDDDEAKTIYQMVMIVSVVFGLALMPLIGKWCDQTSPTITFPIVFTLRGAILGGFYFIKDPGGPYAYACAILVVMATGAETVAVDSCCFRNSAREIRGTVFGVNMASGYFGQFVFALCGGFLYDRIGPVAPFFYVAGLDGLFAIVSLILVITGVLKNDLKAKKIIPDSPKV